MIVIYYTTVFRACHRCLFDKVKSPVGHFVAHFLSILYNLSMSWCVYMVRCRDGSLYTGCTNDLPGRIAAHNGGLGARYTAGRRPVVLVYSEPAANRSEAQKREYEIKRMKRSCKDLLIRSRNFR